MKTITGGCACGAIRYEVTGDPIVTFNCHCRDCQKTTGSGYTPVFYVPAKAFKITKGTPKYYSTSSETFESKRAAEPVGAFPHAKRVGNLLFLSGIGPRVRGKKEIPGVTLTSDGEIQNYEIEKQCRAVFENVRLVLEDAGATWNDIVDVTVFLTDMKKDFPIYNKLYAEYFAGEGKPNPTRTTVEVTALPTPIAIELKVIATLGKVTD